MISTSMTSVILLDFYQNNADSFTLYHHFEADRLRGKKKKKKALKSVQSSAPLIHKIQEFLYLFCIFKGILTNNLGCLT